MDECLALFCTMTEFPLVDNSDDHLAEKLLHLGDSVLDTVALVNESTKQREQAHVSEEEYMEVQVPLLAKQTPIFANVTGEVEYPRVVEEDKSSINLEGMAEHGNKKKGGSFTKYCKMFLYF